MTPLRNNPPYYSAWAEIDLKAIVGNFRLLCAVAGKTTRMLCVVKADAYGHGMVEVSRALQNAGADFFGVADIGEGITLRQNGIRKPILLFENPPAKYIKTIVEYRLTPTICTRELGAALNRFAKKSRKTISVHVKVDTGMGRLGVWHREAVEFLLFVKKLSGLRLEGIYTHFPSADIDERFTKNQIRDFQSLVKELRRLGVDVPFIHAANSMGLARYHEKVFNLVRPGLMLYGMHPSSASREKIRLKPALSVKSRIMFVKNIAKGRSISYARTFVASKPMQVATIPIGYNDGYFRSLSNKASVLIDGILCPVVGRVTMDQIVVDVTKVRKPRVGMEVVLVGNQKRNFISADDIASWAGTISYEITCSLGNRLARFYRPSKD